MLFRSWEDKKYVKLNPDALVWTPYVMGRNNQHLLEHAPPLTAIAHPEEDEKVQGSVEAAAMRRDSGTDIKVNGTSNSDDMEDVAITNGSNEGNAQPVLTNGTSNDATVMPAIPPHRYEVFPPIAGLKKGSRFSMSATRTTSMATPKTAPARSRPTARRSSVRHATATARKNPSRSRRQTGGTGRGPGRWPKGTTKKDFGNAMSGPGLPPRGKKDDSDDEDDILYETPGMNRRKTTTRGRGKKIIESDDDDDDDDLVVGDVKS